MWSILAAGNAFCQTAGLKIRATVPGTAEPVAVRAIIRQSNGNYFPGEWGASSWPNVELRGKAVNPTMTLRLPPGNTVVTVGKGPDYYPQTFTTELQEGETNVVSVQLQPVFNMQGSGWVAGDIHTHYNHGEGEVLRTPGQVHNMACAGGLNFVSLCQEHYGAASLTRGEMFGTWEQFDETECQVWLGAEEPKNAWGHHASVVYDPWRIRSPLPYYVGIQEVHRQGGVSVPVHPLRPFPGKSDSSGWGLYPLNNFYKAYPLQALTGNLIDGWSGISDEAHHPSILPPYFELLNMGYRIPLMADSDIAFDRVNNGHKAPGNWLNYFDLRGKPLNKASIIDAIKNGRVIATTGPALLFNIDHAKSGDTLLPSSGTRTVRIRASYSFNPWTLGDTAFNGGPCQIVQIDLFRNGEVIKTWNPNAAAVNLTYPIVESASGAYYMVRVLGSDAAWAAAYASPIYFDATPRPRQPKGFTSLVNGRVYNSANNAPMSATVACVREGKTLWTLTTGPSGLFRAYVPLDASLVATDSAGRQISRDFLNDEEIYKFCHELQENYPTLAGSVSALRNLLRERTWEFPLGYKNAASYIRQSLPGDGPMDSFSILSAPAPTGGKSSTEITTALVDKTHAQAGDTINYAAIFRVPGGGRPAEELSVEWKAWDPNFPRLYTKHGKPFHHSNAANTLVSLGNGFYLRKGSVVVPAWAGNINSSSPGLKMAVTVRGSMQEEANLLIWVGATRRQLLVSSTWDGFPATWGEFGIGPCYFHRQLTGNVRYGDYRRLKFSLKVAGQLLTVHPRNDTAHAADADDALFEDYFFYDAQMGSDYRNILYRDPSRPQPPLPNFSSIGIFNPQDRAGQTVVRPVNAIPLPIPEPLLGNSQGNDHLLYWQHTAGYAAATTLSDTTFASQRLVRNGYRPGEGWTAKAVLDLNKDGAADLIWQSTAGSSSVWFMQNGDFQSARTLRNGTRMAPGWTLSGGGDISGDGQSDLIWRHSNGRLLAWHMNGPEFVRSSHLRGGQLAYPGSRGFAAPDLDRNGSGDLIFHHPTGTLDGWLFSQANFQRSTTLKPFGFLWKLSGCSDLNNDGSTDLLWQHENGMVAVWFMNGKEVRSATVLLNRKPVNAGWRLVGAD